MSDAAHSPTQPSPGPLAGLRVLEFTQNVMGPSGGLVLADLGADVIKVEPAGGDTTRGLGGFASGFFAFLNRNKRGLAVDLKSAAGLKLIHQLAAKTDIVIENYAVGTMDRLGCGYEALSAINPRLIYCAMKGYLSGPYEHRAALDEVVQFQSGLAYMTGPLGRPLRAGASVIDIMGGTFAAVAIMAALRDRDRTGKGQLVKSALYESAAYVMGTHMAGSAFNPGEKVLPMPERRGGWGVYQIFTSSDGKELFVAATSDNLWQRFCAAFERPDLGSDPRLATNVDRVKHKPWLVPILVELLGTFTGAEIEKRCEGAGLPFASVGDVEDLFDDPHLNQGGLVETTLPNGVTTKLPKLPIELDGQRPGLRLEPPNIGQHSRVILLEAGLSEEEIGVLTQDGIVTA